MHTGVVKMIIIVCYYWMEVDFSIEGMVMSYILCYQIKENRARVLLCLWKEAEPAYEKMYVIIMHSLERIP